MDNASIHKATNTLVRQGLPSIPKTAELKAQNLVYLPPYSPQLNPVELCFNVLRTVINNTAVCTEQGLISKVAEVLDSLDMTGFFNHCWNR